MIAHDLSGVPISDAHCLIVWGHGWGHNRQAFSALIQSVSQRAAHLAIDFPGFGQSAPPPETWTTADYADDVAELLKPYRSIKKIIWVGHSFGGRVGIQLAARHPELVDGLFLIAAAGLPRQRPFVENVRYLTRLYLFKFLKRIVPLLGISVDSLRKKFGSADYKSAGPLRKVFVNVISEDLSEQAKIINCPVQLIYGENDREASPDIGERLVKLMSHAELVILPGQDHYSVLGEGRHPVVKRLANFMENV